MSEPIPSNTMRALLARPLDLHGLTNVEQLQAIAARAAGVYGEASWLEGCALLADDAPVETHAALRARPPSFFPELHSMVLERAYKAMPIDEARDLMGEMHQESVDLAFGIVDAGTMRSQCEAFRLRPDRFIPGARPTAAVAFLRRSHDLDGWIQLADGRVLPWLYAPGGVGPSAVADAARYVAGTIGVERALVVGTHVHPGVTLPGELSFVCLAATPANPVTTGPEAA